MERLYTNDHQWIEQEGKTLTLGITDFLLDKLGAIIFVNLPQEGEEVFQGAKYGDIEGKKTVYDLMAPASGKVLEVNEVLYDDPGVLDRKDGEYWLIKVETDSEISGLMSEEQYKEFTDKPWAKKH